MFRFRLVALAAFESQLQFEGPSVSVGNATSEGVEAASRREAHSEAQVHVLGGTEFGQWREDSSDPVEGEAVADSGLDADAAVAAEGALRQFVSP